MTFVNWKKMSFHQCSSLEAQRPLFPCFFFQLSHFIFYWTDVWRVLNAATQQVQLQSSRAPPRSQIPLLLSWVRRPKSFCRHTEARQRKLSALRSQGLVQVSKQVRGKRIRLVKLGQKHYVPSLPGVFTVTWFLRPFKDKRLTLRRNTVKSFTSALSVQLPSRRLTAVKCI